MIENNKDRLIEPEVQEEEVVLDNSLRPQFFDDYIGQPHIKEHLHISIEAAKHRSEPLEHILLHGMPGLGKTSLAYVIAKESGVNIKVTSGPAIEKAGDLAAILTNIQPHDILFIDEIHRINRNIEEILYPAMEDFALDIIIGKGPSARNIRLEIPPFTLIGATTKLSGLSSPLRDRFGSLLKFDFYSPDDLSSIVKRSASLLTTDINDDAAYLIAERCRRTPRIANRILKRVRDFAQVKGDGVVTADITQSALTLLNIDEKGLDRIDRLYLTTLIEKFNGGPAGLSTLAASTAEEANTLEEVVEPYLLQIGFIQKTPKGRMATEHAYTHLNFNPR